MVLPSDWVAASNPVFPARIFAVLQLLAVSPTRRARFDGDLRLAPAPL